MSDVGSGLSRPVLLTWFIAAVLSATQCAPATAATARCVGDCDGSGDVTVNEIIIMVNIALGNVGIDTCTAGDECWHRHVHCW
jgi:hypothetical protein